MAMFEINSFHGGISDYEDKGIPGAFKFAANLDIRKIRDSISSQQAIMDEGTRGSSSISPSSSFSPSPSASLSPSSSASPSIPPTGTLTVQGAGVTDAYIEQDNPGSNFGSDTNIVVGHGGILFRTLLKFDISSIPANAVITNATITLVVTGQAASNARTMRVYRVKRAWTEAGVTWNRYDGTNQWTTAGVGNTTDDREGTDIGSVSIGSAPANGTNYNIVLTAAKIQEMISGGIFVNNGFLLQVDTESSDQVNYASTENGASGSRPKLVINYTTPAFSRSPSSSASPSPSPSAGLTTVFTDLIRWFVKCSDGSLYGFGNTGKVYKRPAPDYWLQVFDLHKQIVGACEKPSANGKTYLLFATPTELHRKEIPGNAAWNDVDAPGSVQGDTWPKINLDQEDWHMMVQVGGDVMIANGSKLAMSAYDDSYTNEALDVIPGNIAKTLIERSGRAVIGTYRAADPNKGVNAAIDTEVPLAQIGDDGYIYYNDFRNSIAVKRFPGGGKVNPGGVVNEISQAEFFDWSQTALSWIDKQNVGNMAVFGVYGAAQGYGGLYTFGRKNKNHPFVMNCEYQFDADEIGAVVNMDGVDIFSYRLGTAFGVKAVDLTNKATGIYEGLDFKAPVKFPIQLTQWKQAELLMAPLPQGTSVQFWYRCDKNGAFIHAKTTDGQDSYSYTGSIKADFRISARGEFFEPRVVLIPSQNLTPEVYKIRVLFA